MGVRPSCSPWVRPHSSWPLRSLVCGKLPQNGRPEEKAHAYLVPSVLRQRAQEGGSHCSAALLNRGNASVPLIFMYRSRNTTYDCLFIIRRDSRRCPSLSEAVYLCCSSQALGIPTLPCLEKAYMELLLGRKGAANLTAAASGADVASPVRTGPPSQYTMYFLWEQCPMESSTHYGRQNQTRLMQNYHQGSGDSRCPDIHGVVVVLGTLARLKDREKPLSTAGYYRFLFLLGILATQPGVVIYMD